MSRVYTLLLFLIMVLLAPQWGWGQKYETIDGIKYTIIEEPEVARFSYKDKEPYLFNVPTEDGAWVKYRGNKDNGRLICTFHTKDGALNGAFILRASGSVQHYNFENNQLQGNCTFFDYQTNAVLATGYYTRHKKDNAWVYYDKKGKVKEKGTYRNGKKVGKWMTWYEDGKVSKEVNYNQQQGAYIAWYRNGTKKEEGAYLNNKRNGVWKQWYNDGALKAVYVYAMNKHADTAITYYANGQVSAKTPYVDGRHHGVARAWSAKGILTSEVLYKRGRKDGVATTWTHAGNLYRKTSYKEGKEHGIRTEWYICDSTCTNHDKHKYAEVPFEEGRHNGEYKEWHTNGELKTQGYFSGSEEEGLWSSWNEEGVLIGEMNYYEGKLHGEHVKRHGNQKVKVVLNYEKGRIVPGNYTFYHANGNKAQEGYIQSAPHQNQPLFEGAWTFYYENGKKQAKGIFKPGNNGMMCGNMYVHIKKGAWTYWHPNGKVMAQGKYEYKPPIGAFSRVEANRKGDWKFYDSNGDAIAKLREDELPITQPGMPD